MKRTVPSATLETVREEPNGKWKSLERITGTGNGEAGQRIEPEDGKQAALRHADLDAAGQERIGFLFARRQQDLDAVFGKSRRIEQVHEGMVAALAAERTRQHEFFRAAFQRGGDGDFTVGLVLGRGIGLAGNLRPCVRSGIAAWNRNRRPRVRASGQARSHGACRHPPQSRGRRIAGLPACPSASAGRPSRLRKPVCSWRKAIGVKQGEEGKGRAWIWWRWFPSPRRGDGGARRWIRGQTLRMCRAAPSSPRFARHFSPGGEGGSARGVTEIKPYSFRGWCRPVRRR